MKKVDSLPRTFSGQKPKASKMQKSAEKVRGLRKKYPKFVYESYFYEIFKNDLKISFDFKIYTKGDRARTDFAQSHIIHFQPKIVIKNIDKKRLAEIGPPASATPARSDAATSGKPKALRAGDRVLDNLVFHLGLMEIPSYWKTTCSPEIEIKAGYLDKQQIKWWKDFILNGMGQFFYENKIDFTKSNFLKITSVAENSSPLKLAENSSPQSLTKNFLIPMGEGKDSIVTLELLKKFDKISVGKKSQIDCFVVNPTKEHFKILKIAKIKNPIIAQRKIDPVLLELNRKGSYPACPERSRRELAEGFLNGHTPITAVISNLAVFCAVLFGFKSVVMSCERSSNEGNVRYLKKTINHQWSKSFEFENKYRNYVKKYLVKDINPAPFMHRRCVVNYFSFLRPLYEIQIAKIFSKFSEYFPVFLSCNEARKTNSWTKKPTGKWCGRCSKCLFIWTILYPFVKEKELIKIFGKNLFKDKKLIPIMKELIGNDKYKPFECVGTKKETLIAFYLSYKIYIGDTYVNLPLLLRYFEKKVLPKYSKLKLEQDSKKILSSWNKQNNLPKEFDKALRKLYFK